ncbi:MAG: hypothetical protein LCH95_10095 [Proteobacteria bacterium]|nr:hypothetical protein [Pseudomonadota bacterium]
MRAGATFATAALLALLSGPAVAEPRWLGCKYNDTAGKSQAFVMVFDDLRGTAALLDGSALVDGTQTSINFQSLRTQFPQFTVTYSRNDGTLSISRSGIGGILTGECRRVAAPPGAPQPR